jgi:hypothetical protein
MDKRPTTLLATATSLIICLVSAIKTVWDHASPFLLGCCIGAAVFVAGSAVVLVLLSLGGCGSYGYKSEYTAKVSDKSAELYYNVKLKQVEGSIIVAEKMANACVVVGNQIGVALAPPEAIKDRAQLAISGAGKQYDIVQGTQPESLLPLAKERTKQVQAISYSIHKTAEAMGVDVAAPEGFNYEDVRTTAQGAFVELDRKQ